MELPLRRVPALVTLLLALCAGIAAAAPREPLGDKAPVELLTRHLTSLAPTVRRDEARRVAAEAHATSRRLAESYRAGRSPHFHNFLVNTGLRDRGLCHHWARDLGQRLAALRPRTLVLRWAIARRGTLREHNSVVVTARGQPFDSGVVLDAWRHSGRLYFGPVSTDKYPWREDPHDSFVVKQSRPPPG